MIYRFTIVLILIFINLKPIKAQIKLAYVNPEITWDEDYAMFFTNRTLLKDKNGNVHFKNHTTKQTNSLYFCNYMFDNDSIELNYQVINESNHYPDSNIEHNIFYDFYENQRMKRGVKNFYFVVGGYGKTFNKQISSYMHRLKQFYGDTVFRKADVVVFAWGDEDLAFRYWNGVRASKRGAADFSIFQHMLDEFVSDSVYFQSHPKDFTISILFSSMGNYLFKEYIEERERLNIPLVKTYNKIVFMGSVTPRNSMEEGKTFAKLNQMTDSVDLYVNRKDALLFMSGIMHLSARLGRTGPSDMSKVPDFVNVLSVDSLIVLEDLPGLGHDYFLTNAKVKSRILENIKNNIEEKEENVDEPHQ